VLLAVAHGSSHPASAPAIAGLAGQVAGLAPGVPVQIAFLQHASPTLAEGLAAAGPRVTVVPLLLSAGYHLSAELTAAAAAARARLAGPLGPDRLLTDALAGRLAAAGVPAGTPVVLAAAGSADPAAAAQVRRQERLLAERLDAPVLAAFVAAGQPGADQAVATLRHATGLPVAVAAYLLSPGRFHAQLAGTGARWITAPLAGHQALAELVLERYLSARHPLAEPASTS
jgi:sirohydrochlorin ferrochelatase